jgi:hypothetical protein
MVALEPNVFTENGESDEREIRIQFQFDWFSSRLERLEEPDTGHYFMADTVPGGCRIWLLLDSTTHSVTEGVSEQDFGLQTILDDRI